MKRAFDSHVRSHRLLLTVAPLLDRPVSDAPLIPRAGGDPAIPPVADPSPADALRPRQAVPLVPRAPAPQPGPQGDHAPEIENNANLMPPMSEIGTETAYSVITDADLFGMSCRINSVYNLDFLDELLD